MTRFLVAALLLLPATAVAQVSVPHPTPATYQLCWDHDGINTDGFLIYDGPTRVADIRPTRNAQAPFYCIPFPALTPGPHTLTAIAYNIAGRAPESDPLVLVLVLVPTRVTNLQTRPGER